MANLTKYQQGLTNVSIYLLPNTEYSFHVRSYSVASISKFTEVTAHTYLQANQGTVLHPKHH